MGRNKSMGDRRLADMSDGDGDDPRYEPPKGRDEGLLYDVDLDDGHQLVVRMDTYKGKVVDFALMQNYLGLEWPEEVFRIDCDHGEVHSHQFFRDPSKEEERRVIEVIPHREGGWDCVDRNYSECYDRLLGGYGEHYRRWES